MKKVTVQFATLPDSLKHLLTSKGLSSGPVEVHLVTKEEFDAVVFNGRALPPATPVNETRAFAGSAGPASVMAGGRWPPAIVCELDRAAALSNSFNPDWAKFAGLASPAVK